MPLTAAMWVPQKRWEPQEAWLWEQVLAGKVADLNRLHGRTEPLDPKEDDAAWRDPAKPRQVSERFLLDVLTTPGLAEAVPYHGLRIIGAWFPAPLDFSNIVFVHQVWLDRCRFDGKVSFRTVRLESLFSLQGSTFEGEVDLRAAKVGGHLTAQGATFKSKVNLFAAKVEGQLNAAGSTFARLDMNSLAVGQGLFLSDGATFKDDVVLCGAKVEGQLVADSSTFEGHVDMNGLVVGQGLFLSGGATFKGDVVLNGAKVEGYLDASGSTFEGRLDMNGIAVGQGLFLHDGATVTGEVDLRSAKVEGQLNAAGSTFEAKLEMDSLMVGQNLFLRRGATFKGDVVLHGAKVDGNLDMSDATFHRTLDASAAVIEGELRLGSSQHHRAARWGPAASLVLRNTAAGAIQDRIDEEPDGKPQEVRPKRPRLTGFFRKRHKVLDAWPKQLQLEGFVYRRLGGLGGEGESEMIDRDASWYVAWLGRDASFSPQPYRQLATVFREAGADDKANAVLYALRERERAAAWRRRARWRWLGLSLLKWVIGYGIGAGYFRALIWVLGFTLAGTLVLWLDSTPEWIPARLDGF